MDEYIVKFHEDERGIVRSWDEVGKLVRCKDCKWWDKQEMSLQGRCSLFQMYPTGEWYCGNAELRGEQDEN